MRYSVPIEFTPGESLEWEKSYSDYPAGDGWTLKYYFRGPGPGFDIEATADGDGFLLSVASADTEDLVAGQYSYQAFVELETERIKVDSGTVTVLPGLAALETTDIFDGRSRVKIILDAIDALILGKASLDQQRYIIGNRQLDRYPIPDLIALRDKYAALYAQELRAEQAKKGGSLLKTHKVRFRVPS